MKKFTANYAFTNHNFVIQNLQGGRVINEYLPAICIIKNILQRGCPTSPSVFLQSHIGKVHEQKNSYALINTELPIWERIIRGDRKNNYYPAKKFFESLIPKYFSEYAFIQQLIIPEIPINEITKIEVLEFAEQQVDFYLPQAFLVIEIDGSQHDREKDKARDEHLAKYGIMTVRISTSELEAENEAFKSKIVQIQERIQLIGKRQEEKKLEKPELVSFSDYKKAFQENQNYNDPVYKATSVIRFQLLILELLENGKLNFSDKWDIAVLCREQEAFEEIACQDLQLWFKHLFRLHKINFVFPGIKITRVNSFDELKKEKSVIKVDFSISKRYTDEFQNNSEIVYVRTDYLDHFRYYKNTNAINPQYIGLEPYDYFRISTTELVNYRFQFKGENDDGEALSFFLENIFGHNKFNSGQLPIITNALTRNDTIGLLPTGGGKSICYQLAVLLQPGISFVVCPIKSLMFDQKADLDSIYISRVSHITSNDDGEDKEKIMDNFSNGKYFFIFISPERFQLKNFRQYLSAVNQNFKLAYSIIDEVHCLSEWGHDFRTSYLNLSKTIQKYCTDYRFIGLTATASLNVLKDIQIEFGIKPENVKTLTDYTRKELDFEVIDDNNNKLRNIKSILNELQQQDNILSPSGENSRCGIIFTSTVNGAKGCYRLATDLSTEFHTPIKYYSGQVPVVNRVPVMKNDLFEEYKNQVQVDFKKNDFTLLAATKAFGMGVNKRNVHYTIHYGIPGSMEALYQEAGRAGRDGVKFSETKAKCYVLFSKTSDEDLLQTIWSRNTTLSQINNTLQSIDGDVNTNLFLFTSGIDVIKDEYELIVRLISTYAVTSKKNVTIRARNLDSTKAKMEKAIYRLSQLGIIDDWTINNFFTGEFEVDFSTYSENSIKENLKKTINKYDKEFDFALLAENELYKNYNEIWKKDVSLLDKCIVVLLQWAYDHFAYNRRQSLKNIYENCNDYVLQKITKEEFKQRLENYFKFSEVSYLLQHIAENPEDFKKWFEVFYQVENNQLSNKLINWEQRQSLLANLSRFLESYEYNTGLDFVSGVLRLLIDDFENKDGKERFESSFKKIVSFDKDNFEYILEMLLSIGSEMSMKSRNYLSYSILSFFPDDAEMIKKLQLKLKDEYSTGIVLSKFNKRLTRINQLLHEGLAEIR